jgi:hypothetical protein
LEKSGGGGGDAAGGVCAHTGADNAIRVATAAIVTLSMEAPLQRLSVS